MSGLAQDLYYALRCLRRSPGFTAVAVVTLALGIGANTTLFSVLDAVLLRPLPYHDPDRVIEIWGRDAERSGMRVPDAIVQAIRQKSGTVEAVATHGPDGGTLRTDRGPVRIFGRHVSANFLDVLGVQPFIGRGFLPQDGDSAEPPVAVVSYRFWQARLAGDRQALGRTLLINDTPYTVIGVMPAGFATSFQRGGDEFWTPHVSERTRQFEDEQGYELIGRVSPRVTIDGARRELRAIAASVDVDDANWQGRRRHVDVVSKKEEMIGDSARALQLLFIAVAVVLAIACANLALLSLARADRRAAEFATRKAIGASTSRLFRLALAESLLISAAGATTGIALSQWLLPAMLAFAPSDLPRITEAVINWRVLGLALLLALTTACAFGSAPAVQLSRLSVVETMKGLKDTPSVRSARVRAALVAGQVAASVALLVLTVLLGRTFLTLVPTNPGVESRGRTVFLLSLPPGQPPQSTERWRIVDELLRRLEGTAGITEAAFGLNVPFGGDDGFRLVRDVQHTDSSTGLSADVRSISTNYFDVLQMPLRRGRPFTADDRPQALPRVAIVNETFARRLRSGGDAIGRRIQIGAGRTPPASNAIAYEIVGIVADARSSGTTADIWNEVYVPYVQTNPSYGYIIVRSELDSSTLDRIIREEVRATLPQWVDDPFLRARSMEALVDQSFSAPRFTATLITAFSANALLLSAIGVFGLVSYSVSRRRSELGLRAALGAESTDLIATTMRTAMTSTVMGVAIGLSGAAYLTQFIESQLYGTTPSDPLAFLGASVMMLMVAGGAAYIPSRRAASIDPIVALRNSE